MNAMMNAQQDFLLIKAEKINARYFVRGVSLKFRKNLFIKNESQKIG